MMIHKLWIATVLFIIVIILPSICHAANNTSLTFVQHTSTQNNTSLASKSNHVRKVTFISPRRQFNPYSYNNAPLFPTSKRNTYLSKVMLPYFITPLGAKDPRKHQEINFRNKRKHKYYIFWSRIRRKNERLKKQLNDVLFPKPKDRVRVDHEPISYSVVKSNNTIRTDNSANISTNEPQTPRQIPISTKDKCYRYDVNGCSIPFGAPFFFKKLFTNCCDRHDVCYHCGVGYGIERQQCDEMFKDNMWRTCLARYQEKGNEIAGQASRKPRIIYATEKLLKEFNIILKNQMSPQMFSTGHWKKDVDRFNTHARSIQRNTLKQWVFLLRRNIAFKFKKEKTQGNVTVTAIQPISASSNGTASILPEEKRRHEEPFRRNLTSDFCQDILRTDPSELNIDKRVILFCNEVDLLSCRFFHDVYYLSVRVFGASSYHQQPEFFCNQEFVKECLKPIVPS